MTEEEENMVNVDDEKEDEEALPLKMKKERAVMGRVFKLNRPELPLLVLGMWRAH